MQGEHATGIASEARTAVMRAGSGAEVKGDAVRLIWGPEVEVLSGRGLGENQRGPDEWVLGFRQSDVRGGQCGACDVLRSSL